MNILMFRPTKGIKRGDIRPYYISKYLKENHFKLTEILDWKMNPFINNQLKNYFQILKFKLNKNEKILFTEGIISNRFSILSNLFLRYSYILDFNDDPVLQHEAFKSSISSKVKQTLIDNRINCFHKANMILFPSKTLMSYYKDISEKSHVIMNASDPNYIKSNSYPKQPTIGILTGIAKGRGLELLFDACTIVKKEIPNLQLKIGYVEGDMNYGTLIRKKYSNKWIHFYNDITYFNGAPQFYSSCTITVIPHIKHKYLDAATPIKLFDSMAAARPIVATNCTEQAKIIKNEKCGYICNFSSADMAEKILKILTNENEIRKMGKNARTAIIERHSWKHRGNELANLLKKNYF